MRANLTLLSTVTAMLAPPLLPQAAAQFVSAQEPPVLEAVAPPNPAGNSVSVEYGDPREVVDNLGWLFGVPKKLLLWDRRADNHDVSPATVDEAADFLVENEVDGVLIRVNQHDPVGEWRRLQQNDRVGLPWRATVGALYTLGYTVLPGRLFGGDWYNPYTDTVHVYSDLEPLALEQAAHAKDVHDRDHPGFYAAVRMVPFVGLVHEARSKQAVFEHVDETGSPEERAEARRVLHPQMGAEVGGQAAVFLPQADALLQLGGAAVGHAIGRYEAKQIAEEVPPVHQGGPPVDESQGGP